MGTNNNFREESLIFFLEHAPKIGEIALKYYQNLSENDVQEKEGHFHDPVTIADREISDYIVPILRRTFGKHAILLTEESVKDFRDYIELQRGKPIIIVDELDGTKNFKEGKEHFSILFGVAEKSNEEYHMSVGLVYKPLTQEFYFATIDSPAIYRDAHGIEKKLEVSKRDKLIVGQSPVNVAIGRETFPRNYPHAYYQVTEEFEKFGRIHKKQVNLHSKFSCGLEIIDVAKGDVDVYLCAKAANWDYAGASLILTQAGGKAYLAKSLEMLASPQPWCLQLEQPGAYYPAFFTNSAIDKDLFKYLLKKNGVRKETN